MSRSLSLVAVQAAPRPIGAPLAGFADEVKQAIADTDATDVVVFPELHLFGGPGPDHERSDALRDSAEPLDGERVSVLRQIAGDLGVWLLPGTICESDADGHLFNTQVVLSPEGELVASYRKIFPWRPYEPYDPGTRFVTVDLPGIGRMGLNICYDAWFPETSRQLAWMGAEVVVNVAKTTTRDRAQEVVLARANAIVNQVFVVSLNCAGPIGMGESLVVDPEGRVIATAPGAEPSAIAVELDLAEVDRVREHGTAGVNRMWSQFHPGEPAIDLPVYRGRIDPATWNPAHSTSTRSIF